MVTTLAQKAVGSGMIQRLFYIASGPDGEIGRRKGFKIPRWKHRAGSIPAPGTIFLRSLLGGVDNLSAELDNNQFVNGNQRDWSGKMEGILRRAGKALLSTTLLLAALTAEASHSVHDSVARNDLVQVKALVKKGASLNRPNRYDERPLHLARTAEMMELLIEGGADVNIKNRFGDSPLLQAVFKGDHALAALLIKHGADVNHSNRFGDTPLQEAVNRDLIVMAKMMVDNGASLDVQGKHGDTVLHMAVRRGNRPMVRMLIQAGASTEVKNDDQYIALDLAVGRSMKSDLVNYKMFR